MLPEQRETLDKRTSSWTSCQGPAVRSHWQVLGSSMTDPEKKSDSSSSVAPFKKEFFFLKTDFVYGLNIAGSGQWAQTPL